MTQPPSTTQISPQPSEAPIGIKIKEITKPEEIRITDDRPKILKTIKSNEATKTPSPASYSQEMAIEPENELPLAALPEEMAELQPVIEPEIEQYTVFSFDGSGADQPIQLESTDLNTIGHVSMGPKIVRQTDNDIGTEAEQHTTIAPFSAENEIKDETFTNTLDPVTDGPLSVESTSENTSVLQVGDSVVIIDRTGQTQSIPLRVAGLQRGEDAYDEDVDTKDARKAEQYATVEIETSSSEPSLSTEVFEVYYYEPKDMSTESLDFPNNDADWPLRMESHEASGGHHFIGSSKEDSREGSASAEQQDVGITTEKLMEDIDGSSSGYSPLEDFTDPMVAQYSTVNERTTSYYIEGSSSTSDEITTSSDTFGYIPTSSSPSASTTGSTDIDEDIVQHDQNINFPHITDDLSIHGSRMDDRIAENDFEKIEMESLEQNTINSNEDSNRSHDDTPFKDVEGRSPGEPHLIPEWERNQTTVAPTFAHELSAELSSQENHTIDDETTTKLVSELSSTTETIETNLSTSTESETNVEPIEASSTSSDSSQVGETNNLHSDFFQIHQLHNL